MISVPLPRKRRTQGPYAALVSAVERASEHSKSGPEKVKTEQVDVPLNSENISSANVRSPLALQRHQFIKRERRTPEFHSPRTHSPANASYGWKHPEELEYIQSSEWDEDKIISFAITHSFSIPPKTSRNSILFSVKDVNDVDTTLPMRYRVPLLWVSRFLWTSIYLVLMAKERQKEWEEFKYGILHVARLLDKFLLAARDAATVDRVGGLNREWRCPMFDRALVRYKLHWLLNDPASVEEFWETYGEEEYGKDVIMFDWERWALNAPSGFRLLESDIVKGLTSEELQTGLSKEHGQWRWNTKCPPAILADALKDNSTEAPSLPTQNGSVKLADKPKTSIPLPGRQQNQKTKKQAIASASTAVKKEQVDTSPFKDDPVEVIPEPYIPIPSTGYTGVATNAGKFQTSADDLFNSGPTAYSPYTLPPSLPAREDPFSSPEARLPQFYRPLCIPGYLFGYSYCPMQSVTPIPPNSSTESASPRSPFSVVTALSGSGTAVASGSNLDLQVDGKILTAFTASHMNLTTPELIYNQGEFKPQSPSHPPMLSVPMVPTHIHGERSKLKALSWVSEGMSAGAASTHISTEALSAKPSIQQSTSSPIFDGGVDVQLVSATGMGPCTPDSSDYNLYELLCELLHPENPPELRGEDPSIHAKVNSTDQMDVDDVDEPSDGT